MPQKEDEKKKKKKNIPAHHNRVPRNPQKAIRLALWDVERYVEQYSPVDKLPKDMKSKGGIAVTKQQLEAHVMRTKGDVVRLERMLQEELLSGRDGGVGDKDGWDKDEFDV